MQDFVHLHLHSEYSLLDGACRISDIPKAAKASGQSAVAITDHGVLYGAVAFYKACRAEGIKPIIGCEVYLAEGSRFTKSKTPTYFNTHLTLLAKNDIGYRNLIKVVSSAFTDGFYVKPRVDLELLSSHSEGLICLSGCIAGRIAQSIIKEDNAEALSFARELKRIYGEDFYLEIQDHGLDEEHKVNAALAHIARQIDVPLVATNDVHYISKRDADNQAILLCIQTNNVITDGRPIGFSTDEYYLKSGDEMSALFSEYEGAVENTVKIAEKCSYDFEFGKTKLPRFTPPDGLTPKAYLEKLAFDGLSKKIASGEITFEGERTYDVYKSRIIYEHLIITKMGYDEYYLIVWDFVHYAKTHGIPVGPGRGSGAGSLIAYLIGITDIDSVRHDLLFERFLNSERVSMPDFDIDFSDVRRDEVIKYVTEKYGEDHVAQIITFGTLAARAAVRDVGRALGMSYNDTDRIARLISQKPGTTIKEALEDAELKSIYESEYKVRELIDAAIALEGMPRHASKHAAGVVITDRELTEYLPLASLSDATVTQFDMDTVAELGLLKIDFLGLRFLTVIADAEEEVRRIEPSFDITKISLEDESSYNMLALGMTDGVFQLESGGMTRVLMNMKPRSIEDIMLAIALYRPGPMDSIPVYLENRSKKEKPKYDIPVLADVLDSTCGCIVYQEQVMQICRKVASFSYGRADVVVHAMKKKKVSEIETERAAFIKGAKANFFSAEAADKLYDQLAGFAKYAFNKSHAAAYSVISYRTLYLKTHYPAQYYSALLTSVIGNTGKTADYISKAGKQGIFVLAPDINESVGRFTVVGNNIRYPLSGIKSVGDGLVDLIVKERRNGRFTSFIDFLERMIPQGVNRQQVLSLINVGVFDALGVFRSRLASASDQLYDTVQQSHRNNLDGQIDLFSFDDSSERSLTDGFEYPEIPELSTKQKLMLEREYMGIYLSGSLLDDYSSSMKAHKCIKIAELISSFDDKGENYGTYKEKSLVTVAGLVSKVTRKNTRNNETMAFVDLVDSAGEIEIIVFPKLFEKYGYMLTKDTALAVFGELSCKDDEAPKILARTVSELTQNDGTEEKAEDASVSYAQVRTVVPTDSAQGSKKTPKAQVPEGEKIFIRVHSMNCPAFRRALALCEIFSEQAKYDLIFYDISEAKYVRTNIKVFLDPFVLDKLVEICGKDNVVIK